MMPKGMFAREKCDPRGMLNQDRSEVMVCVFCQLGAKPRQDAASTETLWCESRDIGAMAAGNVTAGDGDGCGRERGDSAFSQQARAECGVKPTRLPHPLMRRLQRQADKPHITAAMTKLRACVVAL
jgi:hypothetical protein